MLQKTRIQAENNNAFKNLKRQGVALQQCPLQRGCYTNAAKRHTAKSKSFPLMVTLDRAGIADTVAAPALSKVQEAKHTMKRLPKCLSPRPLCFARGATYRQSTLSTVRTKAGETGTGRRRFRIAWRLFRKAVTRARVNRKEYCANETSRGWKHRLICAFHEQRLRQLSS